MKRTNIEWTDLSANPLKYRDAQGRVVWACVKKSAGCANCYSETIAHHYDRGGPFTRATMEGLTPFLDDADLKHILTAKVINKRPVTGAKCFLGDMTDVFGEWVPDALLDRLFATIAMRPDVTFQVLTKRADRLARYYGDGNRNGRGTHTSVFISREMSRLAEQHGIDSMRLDEVSGLGDSFPPNVWFGVSVENQAAADERIPHLLGAPAAVRFLSCEPLLGEVNLSRWLFEQTYECLRCKMPFQESERRPGPGAIRCPYCQGDCQPEGAAPAKGIDWVIVGGESGPGSRPMQLDWARSLVRQCKAAGVACFVKQLGAAASDAVNGIAGPALRVPEEAAPLISLRLKDKKGGAIEEWPEDLRIRQFPKAAA